MAISKEEVVALIGEGVCTVKTLTHNHLYCEPPSQQPPLSLRHGRKREGAEAFPEFLVSMNPKPSQHTVTEPKIKSGKIDAALLTLYIKIVFYNKNKQLFKFKMSYYYYFFFIWVLYGTNRGV